MCFLYRKSYRNLYVSQPMHQQLSTRADKSWKRIEITFVITLHRTILKMKRRNYFLNCIVCPTIYDFLLKFWHLQTVLIKYLRGKSFVSWKNEILTFSFIENSSYRGTYAAVTGTNLKVDDLATLGKYT